MEGRKEEQKGILSALEDEAKEVLEKQEEINVSWTDVGSEPPTQCSLIIVFSYLQESVKKYEEELTQLKGEIEAIERQEAGVQEAILDLKHELDKYNSKLKDSQQKIKYYQKEVRQFHVFANIFVYLIINASLFNQFEFKISEVCF